MSRLKPNKILKNKIQETKFIVNTSKISIVIEVNSANN